MIHLNHAQTDFKRSRTQYTIRLTRDEVECLAQMLFYCLMNVTSSDDNELELLILEELRCILAKKYHTCANKTSMKLTRSQARTLFMWLNESAFFHSHQHILASELVDQIYKQIV
jgi:hypothetical protein